MRASSAGWCFAFLKIPQPNVGFATNGGRLNPITPGQDIKRLGILVISNKFGSFQLLAPECLVLLVL